jgi:chromosome transmission fidelity protein 1
VALARGPTGRAFDFSHKARGDAETVDELARVLTNACAVTPGGVVAFFPSFAYADEAYARWVATGALAKLSRTKRVFREPRSAADVEKTLRAFADAARGSISSGGGGGGGGAREDDPDLGSAEAAVSVSATGRPPPPSASSSASANTPAAAAGALMLCVCGGKLSEGINFKDELGRLVVMVGLPFANPEEPELAARMAYLDAEDRGGPRTHTAGPAAAGRDAELGTKKTSRGREYYEALCMRSVNQSVGRAIRHAGDYAAILFCDGRWARPGGVAAQLPRWIGEGLQVPESYGKAQAGLARFFAGRRRREEEERARGGG